MVLKTYPKCHGNIENHIEFVLKLNDHPGTILKLISTSYQTYQISIKGLSKHKHFLETIASANAGCHDSMGTKFEESENRKVRGLLQLSTIRFVINTPGGIGHIGHILKN